MEEDLKKNENGRQSNFFVNEKLEWRPQKKWKTIFKKMEDDLKKWRKKWKTTYKNKNGREPKKNERRPNKNEEEKKEDDLKHN